MVTSGRAGNDSDVWLDKSDDDIWCFEYSEHMQNVQDRLYDLMESILTHLRKLRERWSR